MKRYLTPRYRKATISTYLKSGFRPQIIAERLNIDYDIVLRDISTLKKSSQYYNYRNVIGNKILIAEQLNYKKKQLLVMFDMGIRYYETTRKNVSIDYDVYIVLRINEDIKINGENVSMGFYKLSLSDNDNLRLYNENIDMRISPAYLDNAVIVDLFPLII